MLRLSERAVRKQIERLRFLEEEASHAGEFEALQDYRHMIQMSAEQMDWIQEMSHNLSASARGERRRHASGRDADAAPDAPQPEVTA